MKGSFGDAGKLIAFVGAVLAFIIGKSLVGGVATSTETDQDISLKLMKVASKMNSNLPIMVDKDTRLDTTIGGPGLKFTYVVTLTAYRASEVDPKEFQARIPQIKANVCGNTDTRPLFQAGVTIFNIYRGNDGKEISRVRISPADCGINTQQSDP